VCAFSRANAMFMFAEMLHYCDSLGADVLRRRFFTEKMRCTVTSQCTRRVW